MICTRFACFNTCMIYLSSLPPLCVCRQDALSMESNRVNTEREVEGSQYYDVEIDSADVTYLVSVTVKYGKVFALFVKSPTKSFTADQDKLRHVVETFKTL